MKLLPIALISACLALAGCAGLKLPPNSCDSATFSLQVGPFFQQHATMSGVSKVGEVYHIAQFDGATSYLAVITTAQTVQGLTIGAPPAVPAPTPALMPPAGIQLFAK